MNNFEQKMAGLQSAKEKLIEQNLPYLAKRIQLEIDRLLSAAEKKNDPYDPKSVPSEQSASDATNADARQQSSIASDELSRDSLDVAIHISSSPTDSVLEEKWVGKTHKGKFKSKSGFELFMRVRNRLKTLLVNWLKSKQQTDLESKKNLMIDLSKELNRVVRNEALSRHKDEMLEMKFHVKKGERKHFYGCDEKLINEIFKK